MAFSEFSLVTPKTEPITYSDPSDDFVFCNVKLEPMSDDEPTDLHTEENNNSQTAAEETNPDDYHLVEFKEESYDFEIFEEPEFKYDLTNPISFHREERYLPRKTFFPWIAFLRFHSDPIVFECDHCDRCFKTERMIIKHVKFHLKNESLLPTYKKSHVSQSKEELIKCELCQKAFTSDYLHFKHKKVKHSEKIPVLAEAGRNCVPEKFSSYYSKCYADFKEWAADNKGFLLSEDVFLAYFSFLSTKFSSLSSRYSILRVTLRNNDNVDISQYEKLKAFVRNSKVWYKSNW